MKQYYTTKKAGFGTILGIFAALLFLHGSPVMAQSCPVKSNVNLSTYPNTYFPSTASVTAGSKSITLGAATYGTVGVSAGDILLVIQMQGAQINSTNTGNYGNGSGTGNGYLNNASLAAGNMEYVVAANTVPVGGGTLNLVSGLSRAYSNIGFGANGQYTFQVVRVPVYSSVKLTASISAPRWDGSTGGILVLYATDSIILNTYNIDASALGFRGGGGRAFTGSGSGSSSDYITSASSNANGGKGEGFAGTPKYLNNNNAFLDVSAFEGYPNGSYGMGAPANAGGGGTDGNPASNNDENTGGGGGANGGAGGNGGNAWSSGKTTGGKAGAIFAQASPSRLVMGGGGGAGTTNNGTGNPGSGFASSGGAGGGIIILIANRITGTGAIRANGASANGSVKNDGSGGAGAGGSILIYAANGSLSGVNASAKGGNGGNNQVNPTGEAHGPGGGGGGGVIYSNAALSVASTVNPGIAGTTSGNTINYGATAGLVGIKTQNITQAQIPVFPLNCSLLAASPLSLEAAQVNGLVKVNWTAANELNTREYFIEKSLDGARFTAIGSMPYRAGSGTTNQYDYADDQTLSAGTIYYRIRQVDQAGEYNYSNTVSLKINSSSTGKLSVFPNPARESVTVSFTSAVTGAVNLRLFDLKGAIVWEQAQQANTGLNTVQVDRIRSLPNGLYLLQWYNGLKPETVKLIVNH